MKTLVLIPTYNEKEIIKKTILEISKLNIEDLDILIIDDNSPDKTAMIVKEIKEIQEKDKTIEFKIDSFFDSMDEVDLFRNMKNNLFILERKKKFGLAAAYITGFQWGLQKDYDCFIQMDADMSHHPKYIKDFLKNLENHDLVIGSRYIRDGRIENWSLMRKIISRLGSVYARLILFSSIKDLTGGYNAWKKETLEKIDLQKIRSNGYSFQIEIKYKAQKNKNKIIEIPIVFAERKAGRSKMNKKIFLEAMWRVWWLKFFMRKI